MSRVCWSEKTSNELFFAARGGISLTRIMSAARILDAPAIVGYRDWVKTRDAFLVRDLKFLVEVRQRNWASSVSSNEQAAEALNCHSSNGLKKEATLSPTLSYL